MTAPFWLWYALGAMTAFAFVAATERVRWRRWYRRHSHNLVVRVRIEPQDEQPTDGTE